MRIATLLLPLLLACAPALSAQSLLLVVRETLNGTDLPAPLPARETLAGTLFQDGLVVFDLPGGAGSESLLATATAAGADYLLELTVDMTSDSSTVPRLAAHAAYTLRASSSGVVVLRGALDGTNKDREATVDRQSLARELGSAVAAKVWARLGGAGP